MAKETCINKCTIYKSGAVVHETDRRRGIVMVSTSSSRHCFTSSYDILVCFPVFFRQCTRAVTSSQILISVSLRMRV